MPPVGPIRRRDLIKNLRRLGFVGPFAGGKHEFMVRQADKLRLTIPNPHRGEISKPFLLEVLREADISRDEWEKL